MTDDEPILVNPEIVEIDRIVPSPSILPIPEGQKLPEESLSLEHSVLFREEIMRLRDRFTIDEAVTAWYHGKRLFLRKPCQCCNPDNRKNVKLDPDAPEAIRLMQAEIRRRLEYAVEDGELQIGKHETIKGVQLAAWSMTRLGYVPRFLERFISQSLAASHTGPRAALTPLMKVMRRGIDYWWGGIDPERQWRGTLGQVADWFRENGGGALSEAMARIIAPGWVVTEGGGGYRSREQVPLPDNS